MRKALAILAMAAWAAAVLFVLFWHMGDMESKMEDLRQVRSEWPTVTGTVTKIDFHDADPTDDNDRSYATLRFQYNALGSPHTSEQGLLYYSDDQRSAIAYSPGQAVTVHYDPAKAASAVVEPNNVDYYLVTNWWQTILRILAFPSILVGCPIIWGLIAGGERTRKLAIPT